MKMVEISEDFRKFQGSLTNLPISREMFGGMVENCDSICGNRGCEHKIVIAFVEIMDVCMLKIKNLLILLRKCV
jgi:hypothetical protein